ncbi:hypothetical protein M2321_002724 [Rhodoblastus acidophilus]|uniref:choice-of-anchor D domain-containing protein n=1 Tax=Rhodoblastus acidophilus TaxID=1074 RepID=UPI0018B09175|nr:choice-of-anchor D domain-containing protein [Rhodoblastus acidophilus]MCW2275141.1 hypothetical protein [Rhodoblastus acidophilus]
MPQPACAPLGFNVVAVIGVAVDVSALPALSDRRVQDRGPLMQSVLRKRSEDLLDYFVDISQWLQPGEIVSSARAWSIPDYCIPEDEGRPAILPPQAGDLIITNVHFADTGALVWCANGIHLGMYRVFCRLTTSQGRTKLFRFKLGTRGVPGNIVASAGSTVVSVGVIPATPTGILAVAPSGVNMGASTVAVAAATQHVTVGNTGNATLTISGLSISSASGDFTQTSTPPATLAPGASFTVALDFTPSKAGAQSAILTVTTSVGTATIGVSGSGAAVAANPSLTISTASLVANSTGTPSLDVGALTFPDTTVG